MITVSHGAEDRVLPWGDRVKLNARADDAARNFSIVAWAIRRHLDYVSRFRFQAKTGDKAFDDDLEQFVEIASSRSNFEYAGRHRRSKMIRIAEAERTKKGDVGWLLMRNGTVQGIEGDRIRNPTGEEAVKAYRSGSEWVQGVKIGKGGRHLAYAIHERVNRSGAYKFERTVSARNFLLHGYFGRYDQARGVGPLTASLNQFRDVYENFDYALAKAKASQLITFAAYTDIENEDGLSIDFDHDGPIFAEMGLDEKLDLLESKTPSGEFLNYHKAIIGVALKSLDIPYSFYDESHTNFFGSKAALLHYLRSAKDKIEDNQELLLQWLVRRLQVGIINGEIRFPRGMNLYQVIRHCDWVPDGVPWWDPSKEVKGDVEQIMAGFSNPQRICRERGQGDFYENIDKTAEAIEYAKAKGVTLSFATGTVASPQEEPDYDPDTWEDLPPGKRPPNEEGDEPADEDEDESDDEGGDDAED